MALTPIICTSIAEKLYSFETVIKNFSLQTHTGAVLCSHLLLDYNKTARLSLWWEHSDPGWFIILWNPVHTADQAFFEVTICFFNWCLPAVTTPLESCQHTRISQAMYCLWTNFLCYFYWEACVCLMFRQ